MGGYQSASYQQDVMDELSKQAHVFFYGPGFSGYDIDDSIDDVLAKSASDPDVIILGHAWLSDLDGGTVDPHPRLNLSQTNILKVVILNKEYTNLHAKLDYIKHSRFDLGFTHHHDTERYSESTGTEFTFWPFAYTPQRFKYAKSEKTIDIGFSGVLQNLNKNADQTDVRVRIMNRLFITCLDVPLMKKKQFKEMNIFWNSISRKKAGRYLNALLGRRRQLNDEEYATLIRSSKLYINTLSPMGLVSPRFFECMASGALIFCEESMLYNNIFPDDIYITFRSDLSDYDKKLSHYLENKNDREKIVEKAYTVAQKDHTWAKRINTLLIAVEKQITAQSVA
jgi:spore maturation protein CgeB